MLSKKELDYVNTYIERVPFPGKNYAVEAANKLIKAYELYKKSYADKEYDIILSDGGSITLEIERRNLAHVLGLDYKYLLELLKKLGEIKETEFLSSYMVLEYLIDKMEDIIKHDSENAERYLNYFKVMVKSTIFESFSDFSAFDFGVINFKKDNYDESKYNKFLSNSTRLLFANSNELITPHYVMGLKMRDDVEKYIVETMYASTSIQRFIEEQELVIPTQILVTDNSSSELTKICATKKEKLELLRMYQTILAKYNINASINIMADYESMLRDSDNKLVLN